MADMTKAYNEQVKHFEDVRSKGDSDNLKPQDIVNNDPKRIKWTRALYRLCEKGTRISFDRSTIRTVLYRPFVQQSLYTQRQLVESPGKIYSFFPEPDTENLVIAITGVGSTAEFSAIISNRPLDIQSMSNSQCFALYTYQEQQEGDLLSLGSDSGKKSNITDYALESFRSTYSDKKITKEDIFYYVYGVLHSPEYRSRFASDLGKSLARIPLAEDFVVFSKAGRKLAELHLNYETAKPFPGIQQHADELSLEASKLYQVEKMRFGKKDKEQDRTVIQYNSHITLSGIPIEAYDYVVNGKSAIGWIMDRYQMDKDKDSGILNNPNDWSKEQGDPEYILKLLKSVVTVSMETMKVVNALPPLNEKTI